MSDTVTHETLHRTAKYFMDNGRAASHDHAMALLHGFGLYVVAGPEVATSRDHQVALLTLINAARRTFLGGVHVIGTPSAPLLAPLADAKTVEHAITRLGGMSVERRNRDWPVALIGGDDNDFANTAGWRITWDGWRGGVVPFATDCDCPSTHREGSLPRSQPQRAPLRRFPSTLATIRSPADERPVCPSGNQQWIGLPQMILSRRSRFFRRACG